MTDTPETIRARGQQSIDAALDQMPMPPDLRMVVREVLVDAHLPLCVALSRLNDETLPRVSERVKRAATALLIVNAFWEFIRTTYPEDQWAAQADVLRALIIDSLKEGPLA